MSPFYHEADRSLAVDAILGDRAARQAIKALAREHLIPMARATGESVGTVMDVNVYYVVPDFHFYRRMDILSLLDMSAVEFYMKAPRTAYFRKAGGWLARLRKVARYRRLYASIRKRGIVHDPADVFSPPWLFASAECIYRLDGHHRSSIARYLGHDRIKTLVITPKDVRPLAGLPERYKALIAGLHEPTVDLKRAPPGDARP